MTMPERYDVIVIGAGQAGGPLSTALAQAGKRTALIEREHVGGTCINEGCTPTKTMVASARVAYLARRATDYGVHTGPVDIDMVKVRERKRAIVDSFRGGSEQRIEQADDLDLLQGEARFTGPRTIEVNMDGAAPRVLTADLIFINTGCRPGQPEVQGIERVLTLDSTSIMELDSVPEHLLVLGGGYIGLEFGQMFRRFGSRVTIVQSGPQLLAREDGDVAAEVAKILQEDGVEILLESMALAVEQKEDGAIEMRVHTPEDERTVSGSHLLVAAGRIPNTERLNPVASGIAVDDEGYIRADERLQTNVPGVYALGDVKGGPGFTHISYDDFRIIRTNLLHGGQATTRDRQVPYTVFIDPQLGRVGLSEKEAEEQGRAIRVAKLSMSSVARAIEIDETRGFIKAVVDGESGQILGCVVLGVEGGEIMSLLQMAMIGHVPYTAMRDGIFAHPTLAESLNNLFSSLDG